MPFLKLLGATMGRFQGNRLSIATGLVYSQEPAAQMVAQVAQPSPGMKVLDLAAAPGGKSTQLAAYLAGEGLLVSNEISSKRAKILVETWSALERQMSW